MWTKCCIKYKCSYPLFRFTGSAAGLAGSGFLTMDVFSSPSPATKAAAVVWGVAAGQLCHRVHALLPRQPMATFYTCEFILNAFFVMFVVKSYQILFSYKFCGNQRTNNRRKS